MQGINLIFSIAILIISVVAHEVSHGFAAYLLGDSTAKRAGRLNMNPLKHLDLMGSFVVPLFLVLLGSNFVLGWAKPVPYNPYNLKNQKWGPGVVGFSGPLANFLIAGVFGVLAMLMPLDNFTKNSIALSALNGSADMIAGGYAISLYFFFSMIVWINLFLGLFNIIPIPPLDGSKVLFSILPYRMGNIQAFLERYGFVLLLFFIFLFPQIILPLAYKFYSLLMGIA